MPNLVERAQSLYTRRCPDLRRKVCPGARGLLYRLSRRRIPTGLVTGNLTRIGWRKMEQAGLRRYLHFGAFDGSDGYLADAVRIEFGGRSLLRGFHLFGAQRKVH
jgi:phosphoglycolate phosphatase-like HAD superfamily hydrolase